MTKYIDKYYLNWTEYKIKFWWWGWWTPDPSRTIFYYDFEDSSDRLKDTSWNNNNATWSGDITYTEVWWQYVALANPYGRIIVNTAVWGSIWTWDFAISFWMYFISPGWTTPMIFWISSNDYPYAWPNIFFDVGWKILYRMNATDQQYWTASTSSLYSWWHHIVMTRNNWEVICYCDGNVDASWTDTISTFPTQTNQTWWIIGRASWSWQHWNNAWAMWDKFILEKVWWSATDVTNYYNSTKSIYWIS